MFFESSLGELTKFIANGVPKLSSERSKRTVVLIQSRSVNIKIAGGGEPGLVIMLFICFNEKITDVSGSITGAFGVKEVYVEVAHNIN